jgi:hypothetical protein
MKGVTKAVILISLGLAVFLPFASTYPDGLEKVAESLGIQEPEPVWSGLMPDYTIHAMENPYMAKLISGLIGLFLVFSVAWGIGWATARKNRV